MIVKQRAYTLAKEAHAGQTRRYTGEDYVTHCYDVAARIEAVGMDELSVAGAVLHDVIEMTNVRFSQLQQQFGLELATLVCGTSEPPLPAGTPRAERKAKAAAHYAEGCHRVQSIKVADMLSNCPSIIEHDPEFARLYLVEKQQLLNVLTKAHPILISEARQMIEDYFKNP